MPGGDGGSRRDDARSEAREQAVMLLYEAEQRSVTAESLMEDRTVAHGDMTGLLVRGVESGTEAIDSVIAAHSRGWSVERMPALDRAILRVGVFELRDRPDVPTAVVIDEAVRLAKRFSTDDSGRFVNGVLAAVARVARTTGD